jgi:hypothetical protein
MKNIFFTIIMATFSIFTALSQGTCPAAIALTPGVQQCGTSTINGSFLDNGGAPTNPCNSSYNDGEYWFAFTGTGVALTLNLTNISDTYAGLFVFNNCPSSSPTCVGSATNSFSTANLTVTTPVLTIGQVYYIAVVNWGTPNTTSFCLSSTLGGGGGGPANGTCASAATLACGTASLPGTTVGTSNIVHGAGCSMSNYGVWYTFAGNGQSTTITVSGGTLDAEMAIASGSCGSLSNITCQDIGGTGGSETYTFTSTIGVTYYVYVAHYSAGSTTTGTFNISRTCVAAPVAPPNDLCANATTLACGTASLAGTTVGASNIVHGTGCTMSNYGVWYTFAGDGQITTISVLGGSIDTEMAIASGSCGSLTNITCQDVFSGSETYTFTSTIGVNYYVYVAHYSTGTTTGTFTISRTCTPPPTPPANDLCANATTLACGTASLAGTTVGASNIVHGAGCSMSDYGVWYTFVGDGQSTTISVLGGSMDTEMAIASGSCGALTNITCQDVISGSETYTFTSTIGVTYYVYVANWLSGSTTTGTFTISRTCTTGGGGGGPCAGGAGGNDCPIMQPICTGNTYCYTAGIGSSASSGNNYGCLYTQPNPSWYYFEISTAGNLIFDLAAGSDIDFAVWGPYASTAAANAACGSLPLPADCSYDPSPTEQVSISSVSVGQIYVMLVTNYANIVQDITLTASGSNTAATNCAIVNPTPCAADAGNW